VIAAALHGSDLSVFAGGLILFFALVVVTIVGGVGYRKLADRIARRRRQRQHPGYVHPPAPRIPTDEEVWNWPVREREHS
jgi:hypothetical protein